VHNACDHFIIRHSNDRPKKEDGLLTVCHRTITAVGAMRQVEGRAKKAPVAWTALQSAFPASSSSGASFANWVQFRPPGDRQIEGGGSYFYSLGLYAGWRSTPRGHLKIGSRMHPLHRSTSGLLLALAQISNKVPRRKRRHGLLEARDEIVRAICQGQDRVTISR
jgi:hypothetical protein